MHTDVDLKKAVELGIIDISSVQSLVKAMDRKRYLDMHTFPIWEGKNGYFYTRWSDGASDKKILVKKKRREDLDEAIVRHYMEYEVNPLVRDVFEHWIEEKLLYAEISKTSYDKYKSDYKRFFESTEFERMKISVIDEDDIERFIRTTIINQRLTRKAFNGMRILIMGIFKYAKKKKYTRISISSFFNDLQLPARAFQRTVKDNESEIFTDDEVKVISTYCWEKADIWSLGILLGFMTGLRVGELSALKRTDFKDRTVHIQRTEIKYKDENDKWVVSVSEYPKTETGDRYVILPQQALDVVDHIVRISANGEYLFTGRKGQRIRGNTFNKHLSGICDNLGIKHRSMHKIRKTYATTLIDSNVSESLVQSQMGHADIATTHKYYYRDNKRIDEKVAIIDKVFGC